MKDCIICQAIANPSNPPYDVVFEDRLVIIGLANEWEVKGHTSVAWKDHNVVNVSDLSKEEYLKFSGYVHKTEKVLLDTLQLNKSLILKSGGLCPHFHFHIYPIPSDKPFLEIVDMITMKDRYHPTEEEKKEFVETLKKRLPE